MNTPYRLLGLGLALALTSSASAFTVSQVNNDAAWATGAVINSGNPGDMYTLVDGSMAVIDYEGERDAKNQRPLMQSFKLPPLVTSLEVTDLYLGYSGGSGTADVLEIIIWEMTDIYDGGDTDDDKTSNPLPVGVGTLFDMGTVTTTAQTTLGTDFDVMHYSIDGLTLTAKPGVMGYGLMVYNPDTDNILPFKWAAERSDSDVGGENLGPYLFGRPYSDNEGSFQENHDLAFAIDGRATVVPEPSVLGLLGAGVGALFLILRRRS